MNASASDLTQHRLNSMVEVLPFMARQAPLSPWAIRYGRALN